MATKDTIAKACRMAVLAVCYHSCACRVHFRGCLVCLERLQMEGRESSDFEFLCLLFVILSCHPFSISFLGRRCWRERCSWCSFGPGHSEEG